MIRGALALSESENDEKERLKIIHSYFIFFNFN